MESAWSSLVSADSAGAKLGGPFRKIRELFSAQVEKDAEAQ
jgi:hypothetical protein